MGSESLLVATVPSIPYSLTIISEDWLDKEWTVSIAFRKGREKNKFREHHDTLYSIVPIFSPWQYRSALIGV